MKKKKIKTIKKDKSQFIGKGSFGCVFKPSILCKKDLHKKINNKTKKIKSLKYLLKKEKRNTRLKNLI